MEGPWINLQIDYVGPFPPTKGGYHYLLVIVDMFSKWVDAFPIKKCTAVATARVLWEQVFSRWGFPRRLESDRGTHFTGQVIKDLCGLLGISQKSHIPYHPQSSGVVERMNRTIKTALKKAVLEAGTNWCSHLPGILMTIRGTNSKSTGIAPHEIMTDRKIPLLHPNMGTVPQPIQDRVKHDTFLKNVQSHLEDKFLFAAHSMGIVHQTNKRRWDDGVRPNTHTFEVGDQVMVKNYLQKGPWDANWTGPH